MSGGDETSWRTNTFRQSVVYKVDEAVQQSGMNTSKNSFEMENHVFKKAKSKEEYLSFVARLILHIRKMSKIAHAKRDETSWRTNTFRQSVVAKIDESVQQSGMSTSKNSVEMENHVFQKAKSKEEYLGFVARLILHVREMRDDTSWRTNTFRQSVVAKIDEDVQQSRMPISKNSVEMENHVFQKAKSKEEYLCFVARLILHVREINGTSWRTNTFRQYVAAKIDGAVQQSGIPTSKNSVELENHVFQKAKSKKEYLGLVARLILHAREINSKKAGMAGGPNQREPRDALKNLASQ